MYFSTPYLVVVKFLVLESFLTFLYMVWGEGREGRRKELLKRGDEKNTGNRGVVHGEGEKGWRGGRGMGNRRIKKSHVQI